MIMRMQKQSSNHSIQVHNHLCWIYKNGNFLDQIVGIKWDGAEIPYTFIGGQQTRLMLRMRNTGLQQLDNFLYKKALKKGFNLDDNYFRDWMRALIRKVIIIKTSANIVERGEDFDLKQMSGSRN